MTEDLVTEFNENEEAMSDKGAFLKSSETTMRIIEGLNLQGFQLGGGAVDFVFGSYLRPHNDIDMVYVVNSKSWEDYVRNPKDVPNERISLQNVIQEPELYKVHQARPIAMERMGAPGVQMQGGELPLVADFIEAYKTSEGGREYIMMPIYEGGSYIKIPTEEIVEREINGVKNNVPSAEVQYLLKEQASGFQRTLSGGPIPDRRPKAQRDMEKLATVADMKRVKDLKADSVGFNFSLKGSIKFRGTQLHRVIVGE